MPSILALPLIYTAIVSTLKADATLAALLAAGASSVYNVAPSGAPFPYVEVGGGTEVDMSTMGPDGSGKWGANTTVAVTGRTQTSGAGSDLPLLMIISRCKALLVGQTLTVTGFPSVAVSLDIVAPMFTEVVDGKPTRTQALILRVQVHEGAR